MPIASASLLQAQPSGAEVLDSSRQGGLAAETADWVSLLHDLTRDDELPSAKVSHRPVAFLRLSGRPVSAPASGHRARYPIENG